jgi:hypothetical protein
MAWKMVGPKVLMMVGSKVLMMANPKESLRDNPMLLGQRTVILGVIMRDAVFQIVQLELDWAPN